MATGADNIKGNLRIDTVLTNFSLQYMLDKGNYIGNSAATVIPVTEQSGIYRTYDRSDFLRDELEPRALGGAPIQVSYGVGQDTYRVEEFAAEHFVDDRQRSQVSAPFNLDLNATRLLTDKAIIRRERLWATSYFKTGVWGSDWAGVAATPGSNQFIAFDQTGSNPAQFIRNRARAMQRITGRKPNTLVLGVDTLDSLLNNEYILGQIKYTQKGILTIELLAEFFGVERVLEAQGVYNAAAEGVAANYQWTVPSNGMWLGYVERTPQLDAPTAAALFVWTGLLGGGANDEGGVITRGRDDRSYSDWFHIRQALQFKVVAPELGVFFSDVVTARTN